MVVIADVEGIIGKHSSNLRDELEGLFTTLTSINNERLQALEKQLDDRQTIVDYLGDKLRQTMGEVDRLKKEVVSVTDRRIVCLIDGDGSIFSLSHIANGHEGGHTVAAKLTEVIRERFPAKDHEYQLHVRVFFNKLGLYKTLGNCGKEDAKNNLENFVHGFNQAAERFMMVDIGHGKEMADAKIKANLDDETKSSQTTHVIFAGCHDNGYLTTLREMASGYAGLDLPVLVVPDLFEATKLASSALAIPSPAKPMNVNQARNRSGSISISGSPPQKSSQAYATIAQNSPNVVVYKRGSTPPGRKARQLDPSKPLSKQEPPPCNLWYLTDNCSRGDACRFAHDYLIKPDGLEEMRENSRKSPCVTIIQNGVCMFGEKCCFGHKCPQGPGCRYRQQGNCKFTATGMHTAE